MGILNNLKMKYALAIAALLGYSAAVRLHDCDGDADDHSCEVFSPQQDGMLDKGYERAVTPRFDADTDDIFMRSMIKTYALEKKNKDGSPSGVFIMNEAGARATSMEVLETHKGLSGKARDDYMAASFAKAWRHLDVNVTGSIEVIKMPQFMRFLCSDQYMSLQPWATRSLSPNI